MVQTLPRLLNLSFKRVGCFGNAFSCASEWDLSFCTVTRRQESDWEPCGSGRQKLQEGLVRTAECLAGLALALPQNGSAKCQSAPCWRKEDRERGVCVVIVSTNLS